MYNMRTRAFNTKDLTMKILVIEDDLKLLNLYTKILRENGHTVIQAATALAACEVLTNDVFEFVVSDMKLGLQVNADLFKRLCQLNTGDTPVIVVSGENRMRSSCAENGLPFYQKPISAAELVRIVRLAEIDGKAPEKSVTDPLP